MKLQDFLDTEKRNAWIEFKTHLRVYLRRQNIPVGGKFIWALAIANMGNDQPGDGLYREFLAYLYHKLPKDFKAMYVEMILSDRLYEFHLYRQPGWKPYRYGTSPDRHVIWLRHQNVYSGSGNVVT